MSQSPVGKRLRTMADSDTDDSDENLLEFGTSWSYRSMLDWDKSSKSLSKPCHQHEDDHRELLRTNQYEATTTIAATNDLGRTDNNTARDTNIDKLYAQLKDIDEMNRRTIEILNSLNTTANAIQGGTNGSNHKKNAEHSRDSDEGRSSSLDVSIDSKSETDKELSESADERDQDESIGEEEENDTFILRFARDENSAISRHENDIASRNENRPVNNDDSDTEMSDDDLVDESDEDDEDETSSGYQDYHGVMRHGDFYVEDDSFDVDSDEDEVNHYAPEEYLKHDPTPDAPYPKPDWLTISELRSRKVGLASSKCPTKRLSMFWFERSANNSLWMIQRLQLEKQLKTHTGCVNCLDFNPSGNLLCSGSDDLSVCIWDWQQRGLDRQLNAKIPTGHASNVFQSQFCRSDTSIVSSSRDGTVRLLDIATSQSELLLSSSGEIERLAFLDSNVFVTCGTNASVHMIDLRTKVPQKLFTVRNPRNNRSCRLHTISAHPLDKHMIAVAGSSPYVFLYDLRRIVSSNHDIEPKPTYCIGQIDNANHIITSTAFNSTGDKLLISYNDDDLYVCRTDTCKVIHRYQGHRNKRTIKGCAWFGDNFVMTGSDDGHIYGWDLNSEHIVCFLDGDEGVVNCLSVHPNLPILASCGLEHDIKVWEPNANIWPQTMKGIKPQICKNNLRRKRSHERVMIRPPEANEDASNDAYDL